MNVNFKQPKYVLPVILLPFLCLFFYTWENGFSRPMQAAIKQNVNLNGSVGAVSADVRKKELADKLEAYKNTFREADGLTAVNVIPRENSTNPGFDNDYSDEQKKKLYSIQQRIKVKFKTDRIALTNRQKPMTFSHDVEVAKAVEQLSRRQSDQRNGKTFSKEKDPMEVFKAQMAIMDSINKQNDPAYREELKKKHAAENAASIEQSQVKLKVEKADAISVDFNTVLPQKQRAFISAVIDENVTGFAGSRIRLKLLEDIKAGNNLIRNGAYLFAQISGFTQQRVTLSVMSILYGGKILPVKLEIYDIDGLPGLYVPSSAFRDFTRNLGSNSVQGVTIDGSSSNSQFIMGSLDKVFQSTSSAIADLVRKNKAKLKYNSYLYLVDSDALQNAHKTY